MYYVFLRMISKYTVKPVSTVFNELVSVLNKIVFSALVDLIYCWPNTSEWQHHTHLQNHSKEFSHLYLISTLFQQFIAMMKNWKEH